MTTTEPSLAREIYEAAKAKGASAVDAPVSGGDVGARNATLSIMVGGDKDAVDRVMPLFQAMGKNIVHQGGAGNGQHTKMCNQIVLAGTIIGVCESLLYGYKAGLDLETMLSSVSKGAAQCWILDNLAPKMVNRNFDPGFFVEHFEKDLGIALEESRADGDLDARPGAGPAVLCGAQVSRPRPARISLAAARAGAAVERKAVTNGSAAVCSAVALSPALTTSAALPICARGRFGVPDQL